MTYALVFWTIVGFAATPGSRDARLDWRLLMEVSSLEKCHAAASQLNIKSDLYRCIPK